MLTMGELSVACSSTQSSVSSVSYQQDQSAARLGKFKTFCDLFIFCAKISLFLECSIDLRRGLRTNDECCDKQLMQNGEGLFVLLNVLAYFREVSISGQFIEQHCFCHSSFILQGHTILLCACKHFKWLQERRVKKRS